MKPSEELIVNLMDEEIAYLVAAGNKYAIFGTRASENISKRLDLTSEHVHQVWRKAKL
jgi:hypothetical protein